MIEDLCFTGRYIDATVAIDVALVNPEDCGLGDSLIAFKFDIQSTAGIDYNRLSFYIEGKGHRLDNACSVIRSEVIMGKAGNSRIASVLVAYEFRPEYLYSRPRLAFLYEPYDRVEFIGLCV